MPLSVARWMLPACLAIAGQAGAHDAQVDPARLASLVDDAVARYELPGIAMGVVVDGEIVLRHTRGELRAGRGEPVDADTLFKIASNSKAMTAAVLARQVDAGTLRWDDPVVRHLPAFRMSDEWVTREIQVRDLLIHNSGLGPGAGDLMLWPSPNRFTRAQVIHGLRHLQPRWSFRSRYAYDNTLYIVAGEVAAAVAGVPFDALVRREVFEPLGMTRCQAGSWSRDAVGNNAQPHARIEGRNVVVRADAATIPDEPMMAAGGLRCSLDDMLRWAQAWLDAGTRDTTERAWLSQAQRDAAWTAHMPMPLGARMRDWDRSHFSAYGYGWRLTDVDGTSKVSHTGTLKGMVSALTLLPERGVGIVVLINGDADEARTVLMQALVKQFTGAAGAHDVAHYAGLLAAERTETGAPAADTGRPARKPTAQQIGSVAGRWRDPWFGSVDVCPRGEALTFASGRSPKLHGDVVAVDDRLQVRWREADVDVDAWLIASPQRGDATRLHMAKVDPDADFSYDFEDLAFVREGDCR